MKKQLGMAGIGMLMVCTAWAQETCHWMDISQRYYRVVGDYGSLIQTVSYADGYFAWSNDELGGGAVVEAALNMSHSNWISQEHHRFTDMVEFQMVEPTDPACIIRTGQTTSYHEGDDGDLQPGHSWPDRFTVQADTNLVVDNLTGLMWTRNTAAGVGNWDMAVSSCYYPPRYSYEDWRLPTVREMESLLDLGQGLPPPAFPVGHPFTHAAAFYWTSTADSVDTNMAWVVGAEGTIARWARTNATPAYWPVRSHTPFAKAPVPKTGQTLSCAIGDDGDLQPGTPWPVPRFTIMVDTNLVFDNLWGRMWIRQMGVDVTSSWELALDYCNDLDFGGYDDWRLPTRREAWSLVDFGTPSLLPAGHPFTGAPVMSYWTSTSYRPLPVTRAWGISQGYLGAYDKTFIGGGIWPVRGNW